MNTEESLALYARGRAAWNEWARGMIAEREALEAAGDWVAGSDRDIWNDATRDWHAAAKADFSEHEFVEAAHFKDFLFPGIAVFGGATFSGDALFGGATFSGDADISGATFSGDARFDGPTFYSDARFYSATFSGAAGFDGKTFKGRTLFDTAKFEKEANFNAMRGGASFSLAAVRFRIVPNFIEANFNEAPRLDNLRIEPGRFAPLSLKRARNYFKGDADLPARWRALKRLAVQEHDHEQELVFFKGELRSRRWAVDKVWHAAFWFGLAYQVLSDYGRSAMRPLLIWMVGIAGFGCVYLGQFPTLAVKPYWGIPWAVQSAWSDWTDDVRLSCVAGLDNPVWAALGLSWRKALPFFGLGSREKLNQIYACLYGVHDTAVTTAGPIPAGFIPKIPDLVSGLGLAQLVISAVLIFLVLLALRNQFRIR